MTTLIIEDELAAQLNTIANNEQRSVEAVLRSALALYATLPKDNESNTTPMTSDAVLASMDGMFDDDVTDLSSTVRETMSAYYQKKYVSPD